MATVKSYMVKGFPALGEPRPGEEDAMGERHFKHLTFKDRQIIERGLEHGDTKKSIAERLGKDKSSVSKEISRHMKTIPAKKMHNCTEYKWCRGKKKHDGCDDCHFFQKFFCIRRDRSPGACNGCVNLSYCKKEREASLFSRNSTERVRMLPCTGAHWSKPHGGRV